MPGALPPSPPPCRGLLYWDTGFGVLDGSIYPCGMGGMGLPLLRVGIWAAHSGPSPPASSIDCLLILSMPGAPSVNPSSLTPLPPIQSYWRYCPTTSAMTLPATSTSGPCEHHDGTSLTMLTHSHHRMAYNDQQYRYSNLPSMQHRAIGVKL